MLESDKLVPHHHLAQEQIADAPNLSELEKQLKSPSEAAKHSQQNITADPTSRMIHTNEVGFILSLNIHKIFAIFIGFHSA